MTEKKVRIVVDGKPVFLRYLHDREIPEGIWNNYLKKYNNNYKVRSDEINIWQIQCKYGTIQLYSILKKELCFVGDYKSGKGVNILKRKLPAFCTVTQEGDCDIVVKFPESEIHNVVDLFYIRKKKKISPEHLAKLLAASEQYRFKPSTKNKLETGVELATPIGNEK